MVVPKKILEINKDKVEWIKNIGQQVHCAQILYKAHGILHHMSATIYVWKECLKWNDLQTLITLARMRFPNTEMSSCTKQFQNESKPQAIPKQRRKPFLSFQILQT